MRKKILIITELLLSIIIASTLGMRFNLNPLLVSLCIIVSIMLMLLLQWIFSIIFKKLDFINEKHNTYIIIIYLLLYFFLFFIFEFSNLVKMSKDTFIICLNFSSIILSILVIYKNCRRVHGKHYSYFAFLLSFFVFPFVFNYYKYDVRFFMNCLPITIMYLIECFDYNTLYRKRNFLILLLIFGLFSVLTIINKYSIIFLILVAFNFIQKFTNKNIKYLILIYFIPFLIVWYINWLFNNIIFVNTDLLANYLIIFIIYIFTYLIVIIKNIYLKKINNHKIIIISLFYCVLLLILKVDLVYLTIIYPLMIIYTSLTISNYFYIRLNLKKYLKPKKIEKVSVVIPNYNYANYIESRIDSVVNQTYPIYELIILDDASTDNSEKIILKKIKTLKNKKINIKYIPNDVNSGNVFKQWAKCFEVVTGDYVWIAEADDLCSKYFLNTVMRGFADKDVIVSYCESLAIDENNKITKRNLRDWIDIYNTGKWDKNYIIKGTEELRSTMCINNTIANVSSVVFKNDKSIKFDEYLKTSQNLTLAGDWYFYSKVLLNGKISYFSYSLNYHRMHSGSVTNTTDNFVHYKEVIFIQDSIKKDVAISKSVLSLIEDRNKNLKINLCISDDEIYYDEVDLDDLLISNGINDEILLSIIIPVYGVEDYIDKCLKSVFKSLPIKTEVIVINDGSPDNSEEIILKYREKYDSLRYIKKKNGGLSSVKNLGLKESKGRYVIFLDSDDYVSSNMYSTMLKKAIDKNADYIYCDVLMVYEDGHISYCSMTNYQDDNEIMQILDNNLMAASWNKMIKRELYNGLVFPEGINNEDVAVSPILLLRANHIEKINSPFYKYVQRSGSIQNSGFTEKRFMIFDTTKICFDRVKNYDYITKEMIEGSIINHQILAILLWPIAEIENKNERMKMIKLFCDKFNELNVNYNNHYIVEYLVYLNQYKLLQLIKEKKYDDIDKNIQNRRYL